MKKGLCLLLSMFLINSYTYANILFSIKNDTDQTLQVKAIDEQEGHLWCDSHKNTSTQPCSIAPHSTKLLKGTTSVGHTNLTYRIFNPKTGLCEYFIHSQGTVVLKNIFGLYCDNRSYDIIVSSFR